MQANGGAPRPWGPLFFVALLVLGALLVADVFVVDGGRSSVAVGGLQEVGDDQTFVVRSVEAGTGDVLRLPVRNDLPEPFVGYRVLVVEGGEGEALAGGATSDHVYAQAEVTSSSGPTVLYVTRPKPPEGAQVHDHLDLVYVFLHDAAFVRPAEGEARDYFDRWVTAAARDLVATPQVTGASAAKFHGVAVPAAYLLMVLGVAFGALWSVAFLRARPAADDGPAAGGLGLVRLGGRALGFLRGLLVALALPLVYAAWVSLYFFWNVTAEIPGPSADWTGALHAAVAFLIVAAFAAWGIAFLVVQRSRRRFRAQMGRTPALV